MSTPEPPPPGIPEEVWSKNRLQQYTQRASMPLPVYQTLFEGTPQAPTFRSRVWVDGTCFTSPNTFVTKKMAEQDAAKHALIGIREKVKSEGSSRILQDTFFCKSILHEYAVKMNLMPTYVTNQSEAMLPIFVSSVVLNGVTYVGDAGKNKREAEQFAARSAILSILDSESSTAMSEIVKSKFKFYDELQKVKDLYSASSTVLTGINSSNDIKDSYEVQGGNIPTGANADGADASVAPVSINKRKEVHVSGGTPTGPTAIPQSSFSSYFPTIRVELLEAALGQPSNTQVTGQSIHEFNKPKCETSSAAIAPSPPIVFIPASGQIQGGNIPTGANADRTDASMVPISVNKRKEVHVSGGTAAGPSAAIPQSSLSSQLPTTRLELLEATLGQPSNTQVTGQSIHEFHMPKCQASSAAIAPAPPIVFVPASGQVQGGDIPGGANADGADALVVAPISVNKRKEVHVSGGTATGHSTAILQSSLSSQLPTARVELLEAALGQPSSTQVTGQLIHGFNKPKCQTLSAAISAPPLVFVPASGQVQGGNIPSGANADGADASVAPVSVNKRKEVHVSGGTATGPSTAIPQSSLSSQLPAPQVQLPEGTLGQPSNTQVTGQSIHEFKMPNCQTSSAAIAPSPSIVYVPASGQDMICSASGKKKNRKNKKAKKKMVESSLPIVMIPQTQSPFPAYSVAQ